MTCFVFSGYVMMACFVFSGEVGGHCYDGGGG